MTVHRSIPCKRCGLSGSPWRMYPDDCPTCGLDAQSIAFHTGMIDRHNGRDPRPQHPVVDSYLRGYASDYATETRR